MRSVRLAVAALALIITCYDSARATTYYVRASGDESNNGLTPHTAHASIRTTGRLLRRPGDRLIVGPGTYHEGNIQPLGSGTPDAPIVLFADTTGNLTGDAPGPVIIVPPNAQDSTTGFIIYGLHDVQIEGFTIDGAKDAGIQVRAQRRTGTDSTRITLLADTATAGRVGIHIIAAGVVTVANNRLTNNGRSGLTIVSGSSAVQPVVSGNVIEQNRVAIWIVGSAGGAVSANALQANGGGLEIRNTTGLSITNNTIGGAGRAGTIFGVNLEISGNTIEGDGMIHAANGRLLVADNRFEAGTSHPPERNRFLVFADGAQVAMLRNRFTSLYMTGGTQIDLDGNDADYLVATDGGALSVHNNHFGGLRIRRASTVQAQQNTAGGLEVRASDVVMEDHDVSGGAYVVADSGMICGNRLQSLLLVHSYRPPRVRAPSREGSIIVQNNVTQNALVIREPDASAALVEDNVVGGVLKVAARDELSVRRNDAHGIACVLAGPDSHLELAENNSHDAAVVRGLVVIGAGSAVIENNASSNNADTGLAVRHAKQVRIDGNDFLGNAAGGVSVQIPVAADCNRDLRVTIDDIITAIAIALDQRPLSDCAAADLDGDGRVTIGEIVVAVADALNPTDLNDSSVELGSNRVENNGRFGIGVFAIGPVSATGNRVVQNAGIPLAIYGGGFPEHVEVIDNVLGGGGAQGLLLDGVTGATVRNNLVFSNREAGVLLRDAPGAAVVNNLVYANRNDGIAVGLGGVLPSANAVLRNNTVYGNAGWGIAIGNALAPSTGAMIEDNILQDNGRGGVAASVDSLLGLTVGFNLNDDGVGEGIEPAASDFSADPQFISPAGSDGILGGLGFADDDFHVGAASPVIDVGSGSAAALGITGSVIAGQTGDPGVVDLGYHYGALP